MSTCSFGPWGLGLLIGIAALGVVTIHAVVERRQQIGFQRGMVQSVFLLENMYVSGLGTIIGYALALAFAYNPYLQMAADQGLAFLPPWAMLFTAWLHARQGAKVVIAEALRYHNSDTKAYRLARIV